MLNVFKRRQPQAKPTASAADVILEKGIDVLVAERDFHLSEANRLANIVRNAQAALDQHNRLFEAINNTLFNINHPFNDAPPVEIADDLFDDIEIDFDLSVDHPTADEELAAEIVAPSPATKEDKAAGVPWVDQTGGPSPQPLDRTEGPEVFVPEKLDMPTNLRPFRKRR